MPYFVESYSCFQKPIFCRKKKDISKKFCPRKKKGWLPLCNFIGLNVFIAYLDTQRKTSNFLQFQTPSFLKKLFCELNVFFFTITLSFCRLYQKRTIICFGGQGKGCNFKRMKAQNKFRNKKNLRSTDKRYVAVSQLCELQKQVNLDLLHLVLFFFTKRKKHAMFRRKLFLLSKTNFLQKKKDISKMFCPRKKKGWLPLCNFIGLNVFIAYLDTQRKTSNFLQFQTPSFLKKSFCELNVFFSRLPSLFVDFIKKEQLFVLAGRGRDATLNEWKHRINFETKKTSDPLINVMWLYHSFVSCKNR